MTDAVSHRRDAVARSLTADERARLAASDEPDPRATLVGLALSGGGIRSATFALGVLQALGERGLLWMFDYLSTVSGGGYTGGWWSAWLSRPDTRLGDRLFPADERLEPDRFPATLLDEHNVPQAPPDHLPAGTPDGSRSAWLRDPIHHLRLYSNYLTPRKGAFSVDTWRAAAIISRNLVLTWLILLPLLLAAVVAAQLYFAGSDATAYRFVCSRPDSVAVDTLWRMPAEGGPGLSVRAIVRTPHARSDTMPACQDAFAADSMRVASLARTGRLTAADTLRLRPGGVRHGVVLRERLDLVTDPLLASLLVLGALTLLWMLYGAGSVPSTFIGFAALVALLAPILRTAGTGGAGPAHGWGHFRHSAWFGLGVVGAVGVLAIGGLWAPLRTALANARDEAAGRPVAVPRHVARDRVRNTVVRWHARVLVVTVVGGVALALAGFGHELTWFLFDPGSGAVASAARRAGGWAALALSLGSALFTVLRAGPSAKGKDAEAEPPRGPTRAILAMAPVLLLLTLVIASATLGRALFARMLVWNAPLAGLASEDAPLVWTALLGAALLAFYALYERWASGPTTDGGETLARRYAVVLGAPLVALAFVVADWRAGWEWATLLDPAAPFTALVAIVALAAIRLRTVVPNGDRSEWTTRAFLAGEESLRLDADVIPLESAHAAALRERDLAAADLEARREAHDAAVRRQKASTAARRLTLKLDESRVEALAAAEARADRATTTLAAVEPSLAQARARRTAARRRALHTFVAVTSLVALATVVAVWTWRASWSAETGTASDGLVPEFVIAGLLFALTFVLLDLALSRGKSDRSLWLVVLVVASCAALLVVHDVPHDHAATGFAIGGVALVGFLVAWVIGLGWTADPNLLALHNFYRARLVRAYLGASNHEERRATEITETAAHDDIPLKDVRNHEVGAPVHVINATLNLVGGRDLSTAQRFAAPFTMSSEICGSARTGYHRTADYMDGALTLGAAIATSGAAVSTNMGSKTMSSALALLLALFNVRLGLWAPTPNKGRWYERQPRLWPFYLLREAMSQTNDLGSYCYLTDGGHFDNTGLYALVERGCRCILVLDDGADVAPCFSDMGEAIRRCRIDFGAEIFLEDGVTKFATKANGGLADAHLVRGRIVYAEPHLRMLGWSPAEMADRTGVVIWVKPAVTAADPVDIRQYKLENSAFPQQTTADQWYDESQFESYRALGYHSLAASLAVDGLVLPAVQPTWAATHADIRRFFTAL